MESIQNGVADLSPEDQQLFWPEIQLTPAEKLTERLALARRELTLLKEQLPGYQDYMSLLPMHDDMLLRAIRVCNYDHQQVVQSIQCLLQVVNKMNLPVKPPSVRFGTALQADEVLYGPEIWATPSQQVEEKLRTTQQELHSLKELLKGEADLHVPLEDNDFLLRFLRAHNYKHQRALKAIKRYFRIRADNPEIFANFLPSKVVPTFPKRILGLASRVDSEGRVICFSQLGKWDTENESVNDLIRCMAMSLENISFQPAAQMFGVVIIVDLAGFGLNHVKQFSVAAAKLITTVLQYYIPLKIKAMYHINEPAVFSLFFNLVKPFLGKQTKNMVHFFGSNFESLHKYVPPEVLPSNYGGKLKPLSRDGLHEAVLQEEKNFQNVLQMGYR